MTTITDPRMIALARMAALRAMIKLELRGIRKGGRPASAIARRELTDSIGPDPMWIRPKRGVLIAYDALIVGLELRYGLADCQPRHGLDLTVTEQSRWEAIVGFAEREASLG